MVHNISAQHKKKNKLEYKNIFKNLNYFKNLKHLKKSGKLGSVCGVGYGKLSKQIFLQILHVRYRF